MTRIWHNSIEKDFGLRGDKNVPIALFRVLSSSRALPLSLIFWVLVQLFLLLENKMMAESLASYVKVEIFTLISTHKLSKRRKRKKQLEIDQVRDDNVVSFSKKTPSSNSLACTDYKRRHSCLGCYKLTIECLTSLCACPVCLLSWGTCRDVVDTPEGY